MKNLYKYLRTKPWLVAGTLLIIITYWFDNFLIKQEQDYLSLHDKQTVELFHNFSYMNEKFIARYLTYLNQEKFTNPNERERVLQQTLGEHGMSMLSLLYMNNRRGASAEDLEEMTRNLAQNHGRIYMYLTNHDSVNLRHFVDSIGMTFSLGNFIDKQMAPYINTFSSWSHHYQLNEKFSFFSILFYILGTIMLAYNSYLSQMKEEETEKERQSKWQKNLHTAVESLKKNQGRQKNT